MKKVKKTLSLLIVLLLIPSVLAGCKSKIKADESAKILFDYAIKGDKNSLSKIGGTQKEFDEGKKEEKEEFTSGVKTSIAQSGFTITDEQVNNMYNALIDALKKVNETASIVSQDGKTAEVKIKSNYIELKSIASKAQEDALNTIQEAKKAGNVSVTELKDKYIDEYVKNMVKALNAAKASSETTEKTYKFIIKDGEWIPESYEDFSKGIFSEASGA